MKGEFWAFAEQRPGTVRHAVGVSAERMDKLKKAWNEVSTVYGAGVFMRTFLLSWRDHRRTRTAPARWTRTSCARCVRRGPWGAGARRSWAMVLTPVTQKC